VRPLFKPEPEISRFSLHVHGSSVPENSDLEFGNPQLDFQELARFACTQSLSLKIELHCRFGNGLFIHASEDFSVHLAVDIALANKLVVQV
jgi:hypothetical protein